FAGDAFVRTELFFGSERPRLPQVSVAEFKEFLNIGVTPCSPDGLTLLTGTGQFRESDGRIVQETSFVLVLLYPARCTRGEQREDRGARAALQESLPAAVGAAGGRSPSGAGRVLAPRARSRVPSARSGRIAARPGEWT